MSLMTTIQEKIICRPYTITFWLDFNWYSAGQAAVKDTFYDVEVGGRGSVGGVSCLIWSYMI
jgi:hypothetical protein